MKDIVIGGVPLEWDDKKDEINKEKHGISFLTAAYVFTDENRVELFDEDYSYYEDRHAVIGLVGRLLFVVYTERWDVIRLISARVATKEEEEIYNENNKGHHKAGR